MVHINILFDVENYKAPNDADRVYGERIDDADDPISSTGENFPSAADVNKYTTENSYARDLIVKERDGIITT